MAKSKVELIRAYLEKVKVANKELTKKEHFKDLLNRLYSGDEERIIDAISKGAETTVLNIPRKDKIHRGSADTLYNKIIIEFENNLKATLPHAKEQLAGYLLGQFNSGEGYNFTLIASDFITWKVFSPDVSCLDKLETLKEDELILNDLPSASFVLDENNAEEFYYWIDRFLFKEEKQKATLNRVKEAFGYQSNTFIECYRQISTVFNDAKKFGEVQVSYEQWQRFLSIAYGSFPDIGNDFVIHTYLSLFAKMLAYSVVSHHEFIDDKELIGILDGTIFNKYNIQNFTDNDFFHWVVSERNFKSLKKVFRLIAQEISTFDFNNVDEDILKGVYQELIDLDTRHSLGEYYTPDWLCERIVKEFKFKRTDKILDPSCGSGSFLRAIIHRMKELNPEITIEELNNSVHGIDIHPLSVQIAKTTLLLALGKDVAHSKKPLHLNVILANTLKAPDGVQTIFGGEFKISIDKENLLLNTKILEDVTLFDEALEVCEDLANQTVNKKKESSRTLENVLKRRYKGGGLNELIIENFYRVYENLKLVKERGRDSIWKFIIQNLYKPYFLAGKFDYIVGNPPWLTYMDIKSEEYQKDLNKLAEKYRVKAKKQGTIAHLEIAAIFLAHCTNYFLKPEGKLAFVLPRSFFVGKQHENIRIGKTTGVKVTRLWDLNEVSPLFNIPSCVFFTEKAEVNKFITKDGIEGKVFQGQLNNHNCNYSLASKTLTENNVQWYCIKQGKSSAFSTQNSKSQTKTNPYKSSFRAGATLRPRTFCFIEFTQEFPKDFKDRILNIRTSDDIQEEAKKPWKGISFEGKVESQFVFFTAISRSILPFALHNPELVVLPIIIEENKQIKLYEPTELLKAGFSDVSKWFQNVENVWKIHRTELNKKYTATQYLNFQNKIITQDLNSPTIVLYSSSAKDANATVLKRSNYNLEFIADHKAYWISTKNEQEAYYLTGILNSSVPNLLMKNFQTRGLFGARDVHKKILDIYFPKYNKNEILHSKIATLSELCHNKTLAFLNDSNVHKILTTSQLGRLRLAIKKHLAEEVKELDDLVKIVIS